MQLGVQLNLHELYAALQSFNQNSILINQIEKKKFFFLNLSLNFIRKKNFFLEIFKKHPIFFDSVAYFCSVKSPLINQIANAQLQVDHQ